MAATTRILYVDDEPDLLDIGKLFLEENREFSVDCALSGKEALSRIAAGHYDVIVSDYQMPGMDGITLLKKVRAKDKALPFILFTGRGREEVVIEALNEGADFYLQKGGEPESQFTELAHKIRSAVSRQRTERLAKDTERRLFDIINFLPDATFAIDTEGNVIAWNRAIEEMTGVIARDILGKGNYEYSLPFYGERRPILIDLVSIPDEELSRDKYAIIKKEGCVLIAETTLPRPLGRYSVLLGKASLLYNDEGIVIGAIESIRDITEQRRDQEELREASSRYEVLIAASNTGAWEYHVDSGFLWCSPEYFSMLGRDICDFDLSGTRNIEQTWIDLLHPEDRERASRHFDTYLGNPEGMYEQHFRMLHKDGHWVWIWSRGKTVRDTNGKPTGITVGTHIEITDRMRAEQELRKAHDEYVDLLEHMSDVYYRSDTQGRLILASRSWAKDLGYDDLSECLGKNIADTFYAAPGDRKRFLEEVYRNSSVSDYEVTLKKKDGTLLTVATSSYLYFDESGNVLGVEGTWRDITERKRAEEALNESGKRFRELSDLLPQVVYETDAKGILMYANRIAFEWFGYTEDEYSQGLNVLQMLAPRDRDRGGAAFRAMFEGKKGMGIADEYQALRKDGGTFPISIYSSPVIVHGRITGLRGIIIDITERKRVEEALQILTEFRESVITNARVWMSVLDQRGKILIWNTAAEEISGYRAEEVIGKNEIWKLLYPEKVYRNQVTNTITRIIHDRKYLENFETTIRSRQGTEKVISWNTKGIPDATGKISDYIAIGVDVTDRQMAEIALRESEEQYRTVIENAGEAIVVAQDGVLKFANPRTMELLQSTPEKVIGCPFTDFIHPDDRALVFERYQRRVQGEDVAVNYDFRLVGENGRIIWVIISAVRITWEGRPATLNFLTEITERKRVDEALKESETRFREIFNNVNDAIHLHEIGEDGRPGKFIDVNDIACQILQYSKDEMLQHTPLDFATGYHSRPLDEILEELRTVRHAVFETGHIRKDGTIVPVEVNAHKITLMGREVVLSVVRDITERKLAEETLRESKERLNLAIDGANLGLWDMYLLTGEMVHNRRWAEMLGFSTDELEKPSVWWGERVHPDDYQNVLALSNLHRARKVPLFDAVYRMKHKDGSWRWVHSQGKIVARDSEGQPLRMIGINQDITEQKRVGEKEQELTEFRESIITNARVWLSVLDLTGKILLWNTAAEEISGYRAEEVIGKNEIWKLLYPQKEYRKHITDTITRIIRDKKYLENFETTIRSRQGIERVISWNTKGLPNASGKISDYLAIGVDVTDRQMAEVALRESEKKYRMLIELTDEGVWIIDKEYRTTFGNNRLAAMFGYTQQEMIGKQVREFMPAEDMQVHSQRMRERQGGKSDRFEQKFFRKDGSMFWAIATVTPLAEKNKVVGAFAMLTDITDRKLAEEALHQANRKLTLLSTITRHDINNQLLTLNGFLALLFKIAPDPAFEYYFTRITTASLRISSMIQFTKEYEKIGVNAPVWQDCRTLVDTSTNEAQLGQVMVKNDLPRDAEVFADPMIARVFYNLMDNAVRYGGKITTIRFFVKDREGDHILVCEDDGDGVPAEEKEQIFERGFGKNTGLGLFLAREILGITGITIKETGEPGKGARFEMTVPERMYQSGDNERG
jgi:PAS domain S-box-containing protein